MPNWACGTMNLVLPTKNVNTFLSYFKYKEGQQFFHRTVLVGQEQRDNSKGLSILTLDVDCAWSAGGCLVTINSDENDCISLENASKECGVKRLAARFEEPGIGFAEFIRYDTQDGLSYESMDLPSFDDYIDLTDDEEIDDIEID